MLIYGHLRRKKTFFFGRAFGMHMGGGGYVNPGQLDTGQLDTGQLDTWTIRHLEIGRHGQLDTLSLRSFLGRMKQLESSVSFCTQQVLQERLTLLCNDFDGGRRTLTDLLRGVGHSIRF